MKFETFWAQYGNGLTALGIKVLLAFLTLFIGLKLIKWVRKITKKCLNKANADTGVVQFLDAFIKYSLIVLLVLGIASSFGFEVTSLAALLGSAGVTLGLALQGSLSNFAGGVLILLLKPFKVGDYIKEDTNQNEGTVTEISLFYTKLTTYDEKIIVLPNGTLANNSLTNVTGTDFRRLDLRITVSYDSNIRDVKEILLNMLKEDADVIEQKDMDVFVDDFGDSGMVLGVRCYTRQDNYWSVKWRILETIKQKFDENNIEIPYSRMDVTIRQ